MGWIRVEDDFYDNDKMLAAGAQAIGVWLAAMGWCNRNLTDGVIPQLRARMLLTGVEDDTFVRLMELGLLHGDGHKCRDCVQPRVGSLVIHDYLKYQPSRAQVEAKSEANRERVRKFKERRKAEVEGLDAGGNALANALANASGNASGNAPTNAPVHHTPTPTPNPTPITTRQLPNAVVTSVGREKKNRGTRLDPAWMPQQATIDAIKAETGATTEQLHAQHSRFVDYWTDKTGQAATKVAWDGTWRNWMRTAAERGELGAAGRGRNGTGPVSTTDTRVAATLRLAEQYEAEDAALAAPARLELA